MSNFIRLNITFSLFLFLNLNAQDNNSTVLPIEFTIDNYIDSIATVYLKNPHNAGIVIGVINNGSEPQYYCYGEVKKGIGVRPDENTIFKLGSIGKTFTALILAYLNGNGTINLYNPAQNYLPNNVTLPVWKNKQSLNRYITLEDLATHFSSLPRTPSNRVKPPGYTVELMYDFLNKYKLKFEPGSKFLYSNLAFGLLGNILSIAGKDTYINLEKKLFLNKFNMINTGTELNTVQINRLAYSYSKGRESQFNLPTSPAFLGAGGNFSSLADMMIYLKYNLGMLETDLNNLLDTLHRPRKNTGLKFLKYMGLGWQISDFYKPDDASLIWKDGATNGFSIYIGFVKNTKSGVLILSNSSSNVSNTGLKILRKLIN